MPRVLRCTWAALLPLPLMALAGCELMVAGPRAKASEVWERSYSLGPTPTFALRNTNGAVTIQAHDQPTITVRAERTVQAATEQGAQDLLEATAIQETVSADSLSLSTRRPAAFSMGQQAQVRYEVRVPAGASLSIRTTNGALSVEGVRGAVHLETVNGRLSGVGLAEVTRAETVNGAIDVEIAGLPAEGSRFETVNGSVRITLPRDGRADLSVRTVNGGVTVQDFSDIDEQERSRRRYRGTLNGGGPPLRVETVNGSVTVRGQNPTT
jgi:hypothetical protein